MRTLADEHFSEQINAGASAVLPTWFQSKVLKMSAQRNASLLFIRERRLEGQDAALRSDMEQPFLTYSDMTQLFGSGGG